MPDNVTMDRDGRKNGETGRGNTYIIISGGTVDLFPLERIMELHIDTSVIVAVDKGLEVCSRTGINPDVIVGDFDSAGGMIVKKYRAVARLKNIEFIKLEIHKDFTDTHVAVDYAIEHGAERIYIVGATGTRFDHTFANVGLLKRCADSNVQSFIVDSHNVITMIKETTEINPINGYDYVSLMPYGGAVTGVTLKGFEYPADNITLEVGDSLGISNTITSPKAVIELDKGYMIVNYSRD